MSDITQRSLTQEELDGFWRNEFVRECLAEIETSGGFRFIAFKTRHTLVEIKRVTSGEWHFKVAGKGWYTYRLSDIVDLLEKVYDHTQVIPLKGEFQITAIHYTANTDATESAPHEPDLTPAIEKTSLDEA